MSTITEAEVFRRVFEPENPNLSPAAAKSIVRLDLNPMDRERMNALAEKSRMGKLSKREDEELEVFIQVGHLLAIMQSKARQALKCAVGYLSTKPEEVL
jgi:hypothetical protein